MKVYIVYEWEFFARGLKHVDSIHLTIESAEKRIEEIGKNCCDDIEEYEVIE